MKPLVLLLLPVVLCQSLSGISTDDDASLIAQKVAETEGRLPWFWCPPMDGLGDIPYTFELTEAKQLMDRSGKAARPGTSLKIERIPIAGGSYSRCLMQNGKVPCSDEVVNAVELDSRKAANFSAEEKEKAKAAGESRRARRRAFWADFPAAFRFQRAGSAQISFTPTGKYRPRREPDTELLARIKGEFWYDPSTFEVTRMEYQMLGDAETVGRLYKGSSYSVTLTKLLDDHYLPVKGEIRRVLPKGGIEDSVLEVVNYRRFTTDSSVQFVDRDKPDDLSPRR